MCYLHRDFNCLLRPENSKPVKRYGNETYPQLLKERITLPTEKKCIGWSTFNPLHSELSTAWIVSEINRGREGRGGGGGRVENENNPENPKIIQSYYLEFGVVC